MPASGSVIRVAGPVVEAKGMEQAVMHELVEVGSEGLIGEIIRLDRDRPSHHTSLPEHVWAET